MTTNDLSINDASVYDWRSTVNDGSAHNWRVQVLRHKGTRGSDGTRGRTRLWRKAWCE